MQNLLIIQVSPFVLFCSENEKNNNQSLEQQSAGSEMITDDVYRYPSDYLAT